MIHHTKIKSVRAVVIALLLPCCVCSCAYRDGMKSLATPGDMFTCSHELQVTRVVPHDPCYGFHPTCWYAWPDCCPSCPPPAGITPEIISAGAAETPPADSPSPREVIPTPAEQPPTAKPPEGPRLPSTKPPAAETPDASLRQPKSGATLASRSVKTVLPLQENGIDSAPRDVNILPSQKDVPTPASRDVKSVPPQKDTPTPAPREIKTLPSQKDVPTPASRDLTNLPSQKDVPTPASEGVKNLPPPPSLSEDDGGTKVLAALKVVTSPQTPRPRPLGVRIDVRQGKINPPRSDETVFPRFGYYEPLVDYTCGDRLADSFAEDSVEP
jgi:hypothetical protein